MKENLLLNHPQSTRINIMFLHSDQLFQIHSDQIPSLNHKQFFLKLCFWSCVTVISAIITLSKNLSSIARLAISFTNIIFSHSTHPITPIIYRPYHPSISQYHRFFASSSSAGMGSSFFFQSFFFLLHK